MSLPSRRSGRVSAAFAFIRYLDGDVRPTRVNIGIVAAAFALAFGTLILLAIAAMCSAAAGAPVEATRPTVAASRGTPAIPTHSVRYRLQLEREVARQFGLDGNVALIAAQIHAESAWRPAAASAYAQGLAQLTPATAAWLPEVCPEVGEPDPWDPSWSIRAAVCYDAWLYARNRGATPCDRWAFTFADYNGGGKWRKLEQDLAQAARADRLRWFGHVERFRSRSVAAWEENRAYVNRILRVLTPLYLAAGWPGQRLCT